MRSAYITTLRKRVFLRRWPKKVTVAIFFWRNPKKIVAARYLLGNVIFWLH